MFSVNPLPLIASIKRKLNALAHLSTPNESELAIHNCFKGKMAITQPASHVILVQGVEDIYYFGIFGKIISSMQTLQSFEVDLFMLNSLRVNDFKSLRNYLTNRITHYFLTTKWEFLYSSFCHKVGFYGAGFAWADIVDYVNAVKTWRKLANKEQLNQLKINQILVGDLINDTYIRFKPAPTVDIRSFFLLHVIWQAHRYVRRAQKYFGKTKPKLFLTSYSTYIQHGIAVRVALEHEVKVFSFGNYQEFAKELSIEDYVHTRNCEHYAYEFSTLDEQPAKLAQAESELKARFSGKIDAATAYMKKSAYADSSQPLPEIRNFVAVFMHDFYDSPHVYHDMVFTDFWEWICFTIETLQEADIDFFLKPHPNQVNLSDALIPALKTRYPQALIISPEISNKEIVEAKIKCAVTVYGTVAHEMAYLGVPSIASARNPHISFSFCATANTKEAYAALLKKSADISMDKEMLKSEALSFYYMHNLHLTDEAKSLLSALESLRALCKQEHPNSTEIKNKLDDMADLADFDRFIKRLAVI